MNFANRILIVISSLGGGGAERVVVDLSRYLMEAGRRVTVLTLSGDDPDAYELSPEVSRERMEIRRPAASLLGSLRFTLEHLIQIRARIRNIDPDVVIGFVDQTNVRVLASTFFSGFPVIVAERTSPASNPIPRHWKRARWTTYRFARTVVVQTDEVASWFRGNVPVRSIAIIPNAVRTSLEIRFSKRGGEADGKLLIAIGRLGREKGFDLLISAFEKSNLANHGYKLAILGEGAERVALERQTQSLGLATSVSLPGHVSNVTEWLSRATIFVLSSRFEGFPNALLEAMQLGVPSISFDCTSGPSEIIVNERNGLLVPPENVEALSQALFRLATDRGLQEKFSAEARGVNERFSPQKIYGQWLDVIDRVCRQRSQRPRLRSGQ